MLLREITALYSEIGTEFISSICSRIFGMFLFKYYQHDHIKDNEMPQAYIVQVR